eukprot:2414876-Ditylum_brightwellii.AAC.1
MTPAPKPMTVSGPSLAAAAAASTSNKLASPKSLAPAVKQLAKKEKRLREAPTTPPPSVRCLLMHQSNAPCTTASANTRAGQTRPNLCHRQCLILPPHLP